MYKLFINKFFFYNYINYNLKKNNSKFYNNKDFNFKNINIEDKKIIQLSNYKNLLIEPYLLNKKIYIIKYNKVFDFLITENFLYYKISCFFITRKYHPKIKKIKNNLIKKKKK